MAASQSVCAGQGYDLAVVEAHAVKDAAEVSVVLGAIWEAAVGAAVGHVAV